MFVRTMSQYQRTSIFFYSYQLIVLIHFHFHFKAQESPEPLYDISDCGMKNVPSGVYIKVKMSLKEALLLQVNIILFVLEYIVKRA